MYIYKPKSRIKLSWILFSILGSLIFITPLNIALFRQVNYITEPVLLFALSLLVLFQILKIKPQTTITYFELSCLAFIFYATSRSIFSQSFNVASVVPGMLLACLYFYLKSLLSLNKVSSFLGVLLFTIVLPLTFYLFTFFAQGSLLKEGINDFYIPNKSIFSILLASQIAFVLPFCRYNTQINNETIKLLKWLIAFLIILKLLLLAVTEGRAGWIGLFVALMYIIYQDNSQDNFRKRIILFGALLFILCIPFLLWYKPGSSNGRLLIYKVSAEIFKDNWLWGIGHGQFKVRYNEYQAAWFVSRDINSKEAMLADNSFYSFNDFFQVLIENGIIGFLLFGIAIFFLMVQIIKVATEPHNKHLAVASTASFISISAGSFFSYPLQVLPIIIQTVICVALINSYPVERKTRIIFSPFNTQALKIGLLLFNLLVIIHSYFLVLYKVKAHQAFDLSRTGFKRKAIEKYNSLSNSFIYDGNTMYLYAKELYYTGQLQQAMKILEKVKRHYCTNEVYTLSAQIAAELKNYKQAEKECQMAIYMVPNRMTSRFDLLEFYLAVRDTTKAIYWAKSILSMHVKAPSQVISNIQQKTENILKNLQ